MIFFLVSNLLMLLMVFSFIWEGLVWQEVYSGQVALDSLRLVTGIIDKMKLIKLFGSHDQDMTFKASWWQVLKVRPITRWIFGNKIIELFLFYILWQGAWNGGGYGWPGFGLVFGYYVIAYFIYAINARKVGYQFTHEKLKKFGSQSETGFHFDHLGKVMPSEDQQSHDTKEE